MVKMYININNVIVEKRFKCLNRDNKRRNWLQRDNKNRASH